MPQVIKYRTIEEKKAASNRRASAYIRNNRKIHNETKRRSYQKHKDRINRLAKTYRRSKKNFKAVVAQIKTMPLIE